MGYFSQQSVRPISASSAIIYGLAKCLVCSTTDQRAKCPYRTINVWWTDARDSSWHYNVSYHPEAVSLGKLWNSLLKSQQVTLYWAWMVSCRMILAGLKNKQNQGPRWSSKDQTHPSGCNNSKDTSGPLRTGSKGDKSGHPSLLCWWFPGRNAGSRNSGRASRLKPPE